MNKNYKRSEIDASAPMDFEALHKAIQTHGAIHFSRPSFPYIIEINVLPCSCDDPECDTPVVAVWRHNGVFTVHWILSKEDLEEFATLDAFANSIIAADISDSYGERLLIEAQILSTLGHSYQQIPKGCVCEACAQKIGREHVWMQMVLSQLASALSQRDDAIEFAREHSGEPFAEFAKQVFDLGYFTGRLYSEFNVKRDIEPDALEGVKAQEARERRAKAAGAKSAQSRQARRASLIEKIEELTNANPALRRMDPKAVANLAAEDAAKDDPSVWAQGRGQVDEYLGEVRRGEAGEELQARYQRIFAKPL